MDLLSAVVFVALAVVRLLGWLLTREQKAGGRHLLADWLPPFADRPARHLPPRPWGLPVIGNMIQLGLKPNPYECMTDMSRRFGAVYGLKLGPTEAVVVNDLASIREVLVVKGDHFDSRPNFLRYHQLFGGDRDNCEYYSRESGVARIELVGKLRKGRFVSSWDFVMFCSFSSFKFSVFWGCKRSVSA